MQKQTHFCRLRLTSTKIVTQSKQRVAQVRTTRRDQRGACYQNRDCSDSHVLAQLRLQTPWLVPGDTACRAVVAIVAKKERPHNFQTHSKKSALSRNGRKPQRPDGPFYIENAQG